MVELLLSFEEIPDHGVIAGDVDVGVLLAVGYDEDAVV